jgi:hypothetical protein
VAQQQLSLSPSVSLGSLTINVNADASNGPLLSTPRQLGLANQGPRVRKKLIQVRQSPMFMLLTVNHILTLSTNIL